MRIDGRELDHKSLETIRMMAVKRVREEGEKPSTVIENYGLSRTIIYKWLSDYDSGGNEALRSTIGTGRTSLLSDTQLNKIKNWIVGKNPMQYGFDFGLWTRKIICDLVWDKFDIEISVTTAGRNLARLGITPQRPLRFAYERNEAAIENWMKEEYPKIRKKANKIGAKIHFMDESGFRSNASYGRTWGEKGKTPSVTVQNKRQSVNAISIIDQQGSFFFDTYTGSFDSQKFIEIIKKFMRGRQKISFLVLDNLRAHKSKAVTDFIKRYDGKLQFFFCPHTLPN